MSDTDPEKLADELDHQADELERRGDELDGKAKAVREDWERKRADAGVPGAMPRDSDDEEGSDPDDSDADDSDADDSGQHEEARGGEK